MKYVFLVLGVAAIGWSLHFFIAGNKTVSEAACSHTASYAEYSVCIETAGARRESQRNRVIVIGSIGLGMTIAMVVGIIDDGFRVGPTSLIKTWFG